MLVSCILHILHLCILLLIFMLCIFSVFCTFHNICLNWIKYPSQEGPNHSSYNKVVTCWSVFFLPINPIIQGTSCCFLCLEVFHYGEGLPLKSIFFSVFMIDTSRRKSPGAYESRSPRNPLRISISAINRRGREVRHTISQYGSIPSL